MKRILIFLVLLVLCLSITAVSAEDNSTVADEPAYDAEIVAKDFTTHYNSKDQLKFEVTPSAGDNASFEVVDAASGNVIATAVSVDGQAQSKIKTTAGNHKLTIQAINSTYNIKPVTISAVISKAPVKLSLNKWISTTKDYATMKVTVKDEYGKLVKEGKVKFTINGKSATVSVKNGVASKNIKLTKAKTYTYKATFASQNYKSKTATSKVYVKKYKKYYTFKTGKYTGKFSYKKYAKILKYKNNGRSMHVSVKIGKYQNRYPIYMIIETLHQNGMVPKGDYLRVWVDTHVDVGKHLVDKKIGLASLNP